MTNEQLLKALIDAQLATDAILTTLTEESETISYRDRNLENAQSALSKVTHYLITATTHTAQWIRRSGGLE